MPSTVEQLSPSRVKLVIELPFADLKPALDKAYRNIAKQANIPGFRKGRIPASLIDQRFGRGMVLQEAINEVLPTAYAEAVQEHKLVPLAQPDVEVTRIEDGDLIEFTAEMDVRPDFDLPDFSTIEVEVEAAEVTEEAIDERLQLLRQRFATVTEVERPAAEGDLVVINLSATQNGESMDDADATGMTYKVGSGGMLDGLDEALTGMTAGETKTFSSKLVGGNHKDQDADIEVTVTAVQEQELPEVDDEFAGMVSEFDTVDEMMTSLRETLDRMALVDQANQARDKVLEQVVAAASFDLPEALAASEVTARREQIEGQLTRIGLSIEEYLAESDEEETDDPEVFWQQMEERTLQALRAQLVLDKLADDSEIDVNQMELTQLIITKAQQNGHSPEEEANHMVEHNHMPEWMAEIRRGKALGAIVNAATITDSKGERVDLASLQSDGTVKSADEDLAAQDVADQDLADEDGDDVVDADVDEAETDEAETDEDAPTGE